LLKSISDKIDIKFINKMQQLIKTIKSEKESDELLSKLNTDIIKLFNIFLDILENIINYKNSKIIFMYYFKKLKSNFNDLKINYNIIKENLNSINSNDTDYKEIEFKNIYIELNDALINFNKNIFSSNIQKLNPLKIITSKPFREIIDIFNQDLTKVIPKTNGFLQNGGNKNRNKILYKKLLQMKKF
jgi:hypothetical protein